MSLNLITDIFLQGLMTLVFEQSRQKLRGVLIFITSDKLQKQFTIMANARYQKIGFKPFQK